MAVRKISIVQLAHMTSIPYRTLQDYLADKSKPGTPHVMLLAQAGLEIHELLLGADPAQYISVYVACDLPASDAVRIARLLREIGIALVEQAEARANPLFRMRGFPE